MLSNLILVIDADPRRVDDYMRKYSHLRFEYFGTGLDRPTLTRESSRLLEHDLSPYAAIVISSLPSNSGPSIFRLASSFVAREKLVIGLIFNHNASSLVRETFVKHGVTRFAHFGSGLQAEIEKMMREGLLPLAT